MVVAGCLTILSILLSLVMIRPKRNQEQPAGDEAHHRAPTEAADA
jgi:hypothetical protein